MDIGAGRASQRPGKRYLGGVEIRAPPFGFGSGGMNIYRQAPGQSRALRCRPWADLRHGQALPQDGQHGPQMD